MHVKTGLIQHGNSHYFHRKLASAMPSPIPTEELNFGPAALTLITLLKPETTNLQALCGFSWKSQGQEIMLMRSPPR